MTEYQNPFQATDASNPQPKRALLVSITVGRDDKRAAEEHLIELERLADTAGVVTVDKIPCHIKKFEVGTVVTSGKLEELIAKAHELNVDLVIFDDEISPSQQRNLEEAFKKPVIDRTELIIEVFSQRALTKEARLQIEMAQVKYQYPRLKRLWTHLSRQVSGGGGYLKGEGEKQIEIDRRLLQKRVDQLQKELEEVSHNREVQRKARMKSDIPIFAIIGYTNAGKSTLLNALTHAGVFVEDKLFATLDTTTRKYTLPDKEEVLLIDTVGFIRKLPHTLVAAFKSTLEEVIYADILIHLIDVSDPAAFEHAKATYEVLKELNIQDKPILTVLNKIDCSDDPAVVTRFRLTYPRTVKISAKTEEGFQDLMDLMIDELKKRRRVVSLRIPQSNFGVVTEVKRLGRVISEEYEENDVLLTVELPKTYNGLIEKYTLSS